MADLEIAAPRRSHEVISDADGLWIPPQAWKTLRKTQMNRMLWSRRFPHLLGRATPAHRLHRPDDSSPPDHETGYDGGTDER